MTRTSIALLIAFASAPVIAPAWAAPVSFTGGTYAQDFDTLANSTQGAANTWTDGVTLPGWYAYMSAAASAPADYLVNNGSFVGFNELLSLGSGTATDRALGSQTDTTSAVRLGVALSNDTGKNIIDFTATYDGEQWRRAAGEGADLLQVDYQIFPAGLGSLTAASGWTAAPASLTFTSPVIGGGGSSNALNGNSAGNRQAGLTATIAGLSWADGDELWIRFTDGPNSTRHQLAVDNFSFSATQETVPIPEPSSLLLLGLGAVGLMPRSRRRRARA